jgi:hypothetical protein
MNCISTFAVGKMDSVEDLFFLHLRSLLTWVRPEGSKPAIHRRYTVASFLRGPNGDLQGLMDATGAL